MSKDQEGRENQKQNVRLTSSKPKVDNFKQRAERLRDQDHLDKRHTALWSMNADTVATPFKRVAADVEIDRLLEFLQCSITARQMIYTESGEIRAKIAFDEQTIVSQYYPNKKTIVLNPDRPMAELACVLVKEMRRAWQYDNGHLLNPMNFNPDQAILVNRAQQADALMMAIRVAWELKLQKQNEMWDFMTAAPFADVSRTYEIHARNDFRSLNDGRAGRAAYDKWFADQRTRIYDKRIIHQMLLEDNRYIDQRQVNLQQLNDEMLFRIADIPGSRNYMTMKGHRAPTHAEYCEVEDRSNANFLWFVKFERNFQEKEEEIIQDSIAMTAEVIDFTKRAMELRMK